MQSWRERNPRRSARAGQGVGGSAVAALASAVLLFHTGLLNAQTLTVTPDADTVIRFSGAEGGPFVAQTATSWTLDDIDNVGFNFSVGTDQAWLAAHPASGNFGPLGNQTASVSASLVGAEASLLAPGVYQAVVSFTNLANGAGDTTRTVELTVFPASFSVSPPFANGFATQNGLPPAPVTVTVTGSGQVDLNYSLVFVAHSWFAVSKNAGTVPAGGTDSFVISFNPAGLQPGTVNALLLAQNATNGAGTTQLPITLTVVSSGSGTVTLAPDTDILASGPAGLLTAPAAQINELVNQSDRFVLWQAVASDSWVSVVPSGGELSPRGAAGGLDRQKLEIRANQGINALPAGVHVATISFQNLTTDVPIATRVVRVTADPVLSIAGSSGGAINVLPAGATLSDTQRVFKFGDVVTLTASTADGFKFNGWATPEELDDPLANPLVVAMDASKSFGATFVPVLRTLNLGFSGSATGTVTTRPTGAFTDNELITRYANGVEVELTAEADAGATFVGWSGNVPAGSENENPLKVVMDRDRTIAARFEGVVHLNVAIVGRGSVSVAPEREFYEAGSTVTLIATADEGFVFTGWGGDAAGDSPSLSLRLDSTKNVQANFERDDGTEPPPPPPDQFRLTVEVEGEGTVSPSGGEFDTGESVLLVATPELGFLFAGWEGDAEGDDLTTTVVMDQDREVRATFAQDPEAPRPSPGGDGGSGAGCGALGLIGVLAPVLLPLTLMRARLRKRTMVRD